MTRQRWYLLNLVAHGASNLGVAFFFVLGPVISLKFLGGSNAWGFISAAMAVGSSCGGLVALRLRPRFPLVAANLALTVAAAPLIALALKLPLPIVALFTAVAFSGIVFLNEVWTAAVQQLFEPHVLARVTSYDWLISFIAMPTGFALAGPISARLGLSQALFAASAVVAVPCLAALCLPSARAVRRQPDGTVTHTDMLHDHEGADIQRPADSPPEADRSSVL